MSLPFLPIGALLAAVVLGGAFAAFALALRLLDRAAATARDSIAPGIVSGLRGWTQVAGADAAPTMSPGDAPRATPWRVDMIQERAAYATRPADRTISHEIDGPAGVPLQRLRRR